MDPLFQTRVCPVQCDARPRPVAEGWSWIGKSADRPGKPSIEQARRLAACLLRIRTSQLERPRPGKEVGGRNTSNFPRFDDNLGEERESESPREREL